MEQLTLKNHIKEKKDIKVITLDDLWVFLDDINSFPDKENPVVAVEIFTTEGFYMLREGASSVTFEERTF